MVNQKASQFPQAVSAVDKTVALPFATTYPIVAPNERHAHKVHLKPQVSEDRRKVKNKKMADMVVPGIMSTCITNPVAMSSAAFITGLVSCVQRVQRYPGSKRALGRCDVRFCLAQFWFSTIPISGWRYLGHGMEGDLHAADITGAVDHRLHADNAYAGNLHEPSVRTNFPLASSMKKVMPVPIFGTARTRIIQRSPTLMRLRTFICSKWVLQSPRMTGNRSSNTCWRSRSLSSSRPVAGLIDQALAPSVITVCREPAMFTLERLRLASKVVWMLPLILRFT